LITGTARRRHHHPRHRRGVRHGALSPPRVCGVRCAGPHRWGGSVGGRPTLFVDHSVETVSSMVQVNAHFTARITHELLPRIAVRVSSPTRAHPPTHPHPGTAVRVCSPTRTHPRAALSGSSLGQQLNLQPNPQPSPQPNPQPNPQSQPAAQPAAQPASTPTPPPSAPSMPRWHLGLPPTRACALALLPGRPPARLRSLALSNLTGAVVWWCGAVVRRGRRGFEMRAAGSTWEGAGGGAVCLERSIIDPSTVRSACSLPCAPRAACRAHRVLPAACSM